MKMRVLNRKQKILALSLMAVFSSAAWAENHSQTAGRVALSDDNHAQMAAENVRKINGIESSGSLNVPTDLQVTGYQPEINQSYDLKNNSQFLLPASNQIQNNNWQIDESYSLENNHFSGSLKNVFQQDKDTVLLAENTVTDTATDANSGSLNEQNTPIKETANTTNATELPSITVRGERQRKPEEVYQSGATIRYNDIQNRPNGNGDITSTLKVLPNVQFKNDENRSTAPGEINPADISIAGGLYNQNAFILDGMNINNDLNPNNNKIFGSSNHLQWGSAQSQGMNVDTSLLDSVSVYDSNISAEYGGFNGGVVEAKTKKPIQDGIHGQISWQRTASGWTQYHIDEEQRENFENSTTEFFQPKFRKDSVRGSIEGRVNDFYSFIGSYSTNRSKIPLNEFAQSMGVDSKKNQRRQSDNFFLKNYFTFNDKHQADLSLAYMPQDNLMFRPSVRGSEFHLKSGGWQVGLGLENDFDKFGKFTQNLSYKSLESTRDAENNFWRGWYTSEKKNWAPNSASVNEGGFGDMEQEQKDIAYKLKWQSPDWQWGNTTHKVKTGVDLSHTKMSRNRLNGYYVAMGQRKDLGGAGCGVDNLGLDACDDSFVAGQGWQGQYHDYVRMHKVGLNDYSTTAYAFYLEDDIEWDLGKAGSLNIRPGVRFEGDNFMKNKTIAHRFATTYQFPWEESHKTAITLGANRYYGRNILSYRIQDNENTNALAYYRRKDANSPWELEDATNGVSGSVFRELKLPYNDEFVFAVTQHFDPIKGTLKYIRRNGRDEIVRSYHKNMTNPATLPAGNYSSTQAWDYQNVGKSKTDVISLSIENSKPLKWRNIDNSFLFAVDWTKNERNYVPVISTYDLNSNVFNWYRIVDYNGQLMPYIAMPKEQQDIARPITAKLSTTHSWNINSKSKIFLSNLWRWRNGYTKTIKTATEGNRYRDANGQIQTHPRDKYETTKFPSAFTWDIRLGTEYKTKGGTFFANLDINNVLNKRNRVTYSSSSGDTDNDITASGSYSTSELVGIYETGRQFWLQLGYKF